MFVGDSGIKPQHAEACVSQTTVSPIWGAFGPPPSRPRTFKLSTDSLLIDELRAAGGRQMAPPMMAMVPAEGEKGQTHALDLHAAGVSAGAGHPCQAHA